MNNKNKRQFLVIAAGWNCAAKVHACALSMLRQTYQEFTFVMVDDGSTDKTYEEINKASRAFGDKFIAMAGAENSGATWRRHQVIKHMMPAPDTVIVFLGLDDELLPNALETIAKQYAAGKWMTYGNWVNQHGRGLPENFEYDFPDTIHASRAYRTVQYRSTAPNTFLAKLYYKIPEQDLAVAGEWQKTCTEAEVMYSCLEMCGRDRIGIIRDHIYLYNQGRPDDSIKRYGATYKYKILAAITARPPRALYEQIP